jgi:hypothetical protein
MTLAAGMRIGRFEILTPVGKGAMGEVWRARDTTLNRDIALKALSQAFVGDPERVARFEREAQVLAALNHPRIASIYGLTESDGETYIELELVEGQALNEFLAGGPPEPDVALGIALQIAEALEAAHAKGVVHRDLKPSNIMITPQRHIKVLDFGLAKPLWIDAREGSVPAAAGASMTREGAVLGTPAYMSPEQARGRPVDQQTDVWAFGCILFELLTGYSPFARASVTETLAKVLERDPDLASLPDETPPAIRRLIRRCLEKAPENRLRHIGDAQLELREAMTQSADPDAAQPIARQHRGIWTSAALALGAIAAMGGWQAARLTDDGLHGPFAVFALGPSVASPFYSSGNRIVAISPDASLVAYQAPEGIYLQTVGSPVARLFGPAAGGDEFFSTDGKWLAFPTSDAYLAKASVVDGVPIRLARLPPGRYLGGSWRGDTIVVATQSGIYRIDANVEDGEPQPVLAATNERAYAWPSLLPDGRHALATISTGDTLEDTGIAVLDLESGTLGNMLIRGAVGARFVADASGTTGHLIYVTADNELLSRAFDPATGTLASIPEPSPSLRVATNGSYWAATFDVSATGTLVYVSPQPQQAESNHLVWIDSSGGREIVDAMLPGPAGYARVSPLGDRVAFDVGGATSRRRIWTLDLNRGISVQLSARCDNCPIYEDFQPLWSPDAKRIYFTSLRTGNFQIWSHAADGSGVDELLVDDPEIHSPLAATRDGRLVVMRKTFLEADFGILDPDEPTQVDWLLDTPTSEVTPALSPEDRWIAYASNAVDDRYEIYIETFPSGRGRTRVSANGAAYPAFATDGSSELYYIGLTADGKAAILATEIRQDGELPVPASTRIVYQSSSLMRWTQAAGLRPYDVSPQDGRILMAEGDFDQRAPQTIFVATNWPGIE